MRDPIVFLRNQLPVPCQQSFRSDDCGNLRQNFTSDTLSLRGKPSSLVVGKPEPTITDLLAENAIFLNEVLDHVLLPLIQPARNGNDEKRKWIQTRWHRGSVTWGSTFTASDTMHAVFGDNTGLHGAAPK
jgi:hypothetical protein